MEKVVWPEAGKRMLAGKVFRQTDELLEIRLQTRREVKSFNDTDSADLKSREQIIRHLFGSIGKDFYIDSPFHCDYGVNIKAGDNLKVNMGCTFLDSNVINIGNDVLIAPNVGLYTAGHIVDPELRKKPSALQYALPINIGNNVWIGAQSIVLPGVTVGDNTIIGAGSVVTRDLPANVVAVGNPCHVLRKVNGRDKREFLGRPFSAAMDD
ncbi:sugar O-acetyltransferase [Furfurilactobacillus rossiae]|uniref:Acetyltransferase n=1 Tax=Furfurilactobacillus rossiae DSM 15814 TaxID=1114972 RepID=A0A0R1RG30_9LACO|nr:sugar O-acetyltransferase [Furfurilactobacillus rossiae]KRL53690.1 galactoside-O-acetyltransferase [Furfurilactobacillus rossiae DSM 15814]QFR67683.1 sugar O-acetyltransferase [Furfurilactobacillus rossiae]QLE60648.1 sugar O-acetyltransferase [Furfurilactobacillus rossiae]